MAAFTYNIYLESGAGFEVYFIQKDADNAVLPFEAGSTAEFQAREKKTPSSGSILTLPAVLDHANGKLTLTMTEDETRLFDLTPRSFYAIEVTPLAGEPARFAEGAITTSFEVVR